ncbi:MAG: 4-hydroxythreonine-4-phosphate dehydrogenase PdxA [Mariprofundaceae bacterium]
MLHSQKEKPILLTLGEPAGIGPDCVLRAFAAKPETFHGVLVIAPPLWLVERAEQCRLDIDIQTVEALQYPSGGALHCWQATSDAVHSAQPGKPEGATSQTVIDCIRIGTQQCLQGHARALVTGPIDKAVLRQAGFSFPGHTEFLADLAGGASVVMMLASQSLRVALLTTHLALKDVPARLSVDQTLTVLKIVARTLQSRFGVSNPHLALCALNPHAGEQGMFGAEESAILSPAVQQACALGMNVSGPLSADSLFAPAQRKQYDAIVCCYHDQALIPIKALSFGEAVNITLGLPFVRTSVDHGTAYERAGRDRVSYSSLVAALRMAKLMSEEVCDAWPQS